MAAGVVVGSSRPADRRGARRPTAPLHPRQGPALPRQPVGWAPGSAASAGARDRQKRLAAPWHSRASQVL